MTIDTPIGSMLAISDKIHIQALLFSDHKNMESLIKKLKAEVVEEQNAVLCHLKKELCEYFSGVRQRFTVPTYAIGSEFQLQVWTALQDVPYGTTQHYQALAITIDAETSVRAVSSANARNPLSILTPCHRIIRKTGKTHGYAGGNERKDWLLNHEKKYATQTPNCRY